eukprot:31520-Pelagococcus_subviridis.AAC.10
MAKIPVPHPTSRTTLPRSSSACASIAARYAPVRVSSAIISRWIPTPPYESKYEPSARASSRDAFSIASSSSESAPSMDHPSPSS